MHSAGCARTIVEFETKRWGGGELPLYSTFPPCLPRPAFLFNRTFLDTLLSLVLWSWLIPESQGQVTPQKSWNSAQWRWHNWAGQRQKHLLRLVPFAAWSESIFVCYLQTGCSLSQRLSVSLLIGVGVHWKRPAGRMKSVGTKHFSRWEIKAFTSTIQFQCFMAHILHFQRGPAVHRKKSELSVQDLSRLGFLSSFPVSMRAHTHSPSTKVSWD